MRASPFGRRFYVNESSGKMFPFLIVVISLLAVFLCLIILIQSGKGGGLAASFGGASSSTDSFMGGRQAATALTKMTWIGGGGFLFLALVLAVFSSRPMAAPESILRGDGLPGQSNLPEAPPVLLDMESSTETDSEVIPGNVEGSAPADGSSQDSSSS